MEDSNKISPFIIPFSEVTKFHGHVCPGTAIGYRAGEIAIKELDSPRSIDEEFLAVVENDSCSVDAIQVITGCTMGKGNLIFKDHGKHVYTFVNRNTGDALRVSLKNSIDEIDADFARARQKAFSKSASENEKTEFEKQKNKLSKKILDMPTDELFKVQHVKMKVPEEARIYKSVKCAKCLEPVSEHRTREEEGEVVCIPCFEDYSES